MLDRFAHTLRIEVTPRALRLARVPRWRAAAAQDLAEQAIDGLALPDALDALLAGQDCAGRAVAFVLSDELARLWMVTPPVQAGRLADLQAAAALRFHALYGELPAAWAIEADWQTSQAFLAAAVPHALKAQLEQAAARRGLAVVAIAPAFVAAWNRHVRALKAGAWFGVAQDGALALAAIDEGRLRAVRHLALPPQAEHGWLTGALAREALLLDLPAPALLQLCGKLPATLAKPASQADQVTTTWLGEAL